jgi:hypothetical protein
MQGNAIPVNGSAYPLQTHVDYRIEARELPWNTMYDLLRLMYKSNGVYEDLRRARVLVGGDLPLMKSIRNPIQTVVRFWGSKLFPRPLEIVAKNQRIIEPIQQVHTWSNWKSKSVTSARWTSLFGESFIHVCVNPEKGRVYFKWYEPCYVTKYEEDERGNIQWIRLDIPRCEEDENGLEKKYTFTEVWDGYEQEYRCWETEGENVFVKKLADLKEPKERVPFEQFGYDFVPFVRFPFDDIGDERAIGAVQLALEAIFEGDISATNLHAMIFQDAEGAWVATAAGTDKDGRPLPAWRANTATTTTDQNGTVRQTSAGQVDDTKIVVGKRPFFRLQAGYDLKSVVPDIDYDAALAVLKDHDEQLEKIMPALLYSRVSQLKSGELSGRALRYLLSPVVDEVMEKRDVNLDKLAQANAMALTLGQVNGIKGFTDVGTFDDGDFEHTFKHVDVIPLSQPEIAEGARAKGQALQAYDSAGYPLAAALEDLGVPEDKIEEIVAMAEKEAEESARRTQEFTGEDDDEEEGQEA